MVSGEYYFLYIHLSHHRYFRGGIDQLFFSPRSVVSLFRGNMQKRV